MIDMKDPSSCQKPESNLVDEIFFVAHVRRRSPSRRGGFVSLSCTGSSDLFVLGAELCFLTAAGFVFVFVVAFAF